MRRHAFHSLYSHDFVRVVAAVPRVEVADPGFSLAGKADADKAALAAFPALGLSPAPSRIF